MKQFDKNLNKLSNLFPGMENLLESFKNVSNSEPDIQVSGYYNGAYVFVDVFIKDTKFEYEPGDDSTGVSSGFLLEDYTAIAKIISDDEEEIAVLPDDKFSLVTNIDNTGSNLETYVGEWLKIHSDEYAPEPNDIDIE